MVLDMLMRTEPLTPNSAFERHRGELPIVLRKLPDRAKHAQLK
jgi:hypothetical protein